MGPTKGLLVTLQARQGKDEELSELLTSQLPVVAAERGTSSWYAFRISESIFGIYDTFHDVKGRELHLSGPVAAALEAIADDVLAAPPLVEKLDLVAVK